MTTTAAAAPADSQAPQADNGHPRGLYILFATEMWERFCFYGMRAILVPFLRYEMGWAPAQSSSAYKWYTSLVYLTPMLGGMLADRYLGVRLAITIGAILLSVGEFMLTGRGEMLLYGALGVLVFGNGFFKPNISTLVGKLYRTGDPRRDGAFTIFYMGINVGAGLAPFVCGTLGEKIGYRWGFASAGVGMALGTVIFLMGQKRIRADVEAAGNSMEISSKTETAAAGAASAADEEAKTSGAPGLPGMLSKVFPLTMLGVALIVPAYFIVSLVRGKAGVTDVVMPIAFALISGWMGMTLLSIKGAARDKASVIFILFVFVVLFWMAFEQAGNALNIWAFEHTDRRLGSFTYPATWFQSVNSVFIVGLAPLFAWLWTTLDKRGAAVSTAAKMFVAMVMVALSFVAMVIGAIAENGVESRVATDLPAGVELAKIDAGRLSYDAAKKELVVKGVLPPFAVSQALAPTVAPAYREAVDGLEAKTKAASGKAPVKVELTALPDGFVFPFDEQASKDQGLAWEGASRTLTFTGPIEASTKAGLLGAGAPPAWRKAVTDLAGASERARVSGIWLFLSYLFATLGELCLSPVGLSMVTKLAPLRFASLFMGVWFLAPSVALYAGGSIGEMWGEIAPVPYFWIFVWSSVVGAVLLLVLVPALKKLMHEVT